MTRMTAVESERLTVDLLDPYLYQRNPHDVWAWMRANEPVYRDERNGLWAVTRHADLMDVERRSTVFLSGQGYRALWSPEEINMIAQDDPRHRQQRMLVQPKLTGRSVAQRQAEIDALVTELIDDALAAGDEMDVIDALAGQLPARFTARILGLPRGDVATDQVVVRAADAHRRCAIASGEVVPRLLRGQHGVRRGARRDRTEEAGRARRRPDQRRGCIRRSTASRCRRGDRPRGRPVHRRRRRDDAHGDQPRPPRLRPASRAVGGDRCRSRPRARAPSRRCCGG